MLNIDGQIKILLIEDEEYDVRRVKNTIRPFEDKIKINEVVSNGKAALEILNNRRGEFDLVIMDFQIAGGLMGEELIVKIKEIDSSLQIIVITKMTINLSDYDFASNLLKAGAYWYCTKYPGDIEEFIYQPTDFVISIFNAYQKRLLERESSKSHHKLRISVENILKQREIIGESPVMLKLKEAILKYSQNNITTLVRGASGTGKELVAYNIHYKSERKFENFIVINCGSIPNELVESELFGYEKGSFTGADKRKPGLFEVANKGTIFLDEVTELPFSAQVKLLRVIQDGEIEKIGRTEKIRVDVRIIAATNRNIEEEVRHKNFREDLYYRLNVLPIFVPELKQRKLDIPLFVDYFLTQESREMGKDKPLINSEAMSFLIHYGWPGNVRELKNIVQRILFIDEEIITEAHVKMAVSLFDSPLIIESKEFFSLQNDGRIIPLREIEKEFRAKYFTFVRNNSESDTEAAKKLGLAPPNYYRMAKELGLK